MNKFKLDLFKSILTLSQEDLHDFLAKFISEYYTEPEIIEVDGSFLYAKGDIPVCVIAHLDTVHREQPMREEIFYDQEKRVMWSPVGIGGDDRCGVFIIMNLIIHGLKPHILFTWNEEIGGYGAKSAAAMLLPEINFMIQFDRRGSAQSVYYMLDHPEFEDYINEFGFKTHIGTYSDICELAPVWNRAAVNLSAGYDREHSMTEIIMLDVVGDTLIKTGKILRHALDNPKVFIYNSEKDFFGYNYDTYPCYGCQRLYKWESLNDLGVCNYCSGEKSSLYKKFAKELY
jgi:hypothetical protein